VIYNITTEKPIFNKMADSDVNNKPVESKENPKVKKELDPPHAFNTIDLKFIGKHKKFITDHVETYAGEYLQLIRPSNDKRVIMDAQAKNQLMYIFCKLLGIVSKMDDEVPEDCTQISDWIEKSLNTSTSDYKIYMFLQGVTQNLKYTLVGGKIEEDVLLIISEFVEDEDLMQHTVELFLLFIKRFSEVIANLNWEATKSTNTKLVNALLRNMNSNRTNPDIFGEIFEFANYCKSQNSKNSKKN
jgi:hypothetical protein